MSTYFLWSVQAYESKSDTGQLMDVVTINVMASDEDDAIARAGTLVERPFYRVASVTEYKNDS